MQVIPDLVVSGALGQVDTLLVEGKGDAEHREMVDSVVALGELSYNKEDVENEFVGELTSSEGMEKKFDVKEVEDQTYNEYEQVPVMTCRGVLNSTLITYIEDVSKLFFYRRNLGGPSILYRITLTISLFSVRRGSNRHHIAGGRGLHGGRGLLVCYNLHGVGRGHTSAAEIFLDRLGPRRCECGRRTNSTSIAALKACPLNKGWVGWEIRRHLTELNVFVSRN